MLEQIRHRDMIGKTVKRCEGSADDEVIVFTDGTFCYFQAIVMSYSSGSEPKLIDSQFPFESSLGVEAGIITEEESRKYSLEKAEQMERVDKANRHRIYEELKREFGD